MIDVVTAIRTLLQDDATFTTVVNVDTAERGVYRSPPGFPSGAVVNNRAPRGVLIQQTGGEQDDTNPRIAARLQVRCHAASSVESLAIYRALWAVFYDAYGIARGPRWIQGNGKRWYLYGASLTLPTPTTEPDTGWPVTLARLTARMSALEG